MTSEIKESRKHIRYDIDESSLAEVKLMIDQANQFSLRGLVINSSYGGCELLLLTKYVPTPDMSIELKFADQELSKLGIFDGRIIWVKELDPNIFKIGIEYLNP